LGVAVSAQKYTIDRDPVWTSDLAGSGNVADLVGSWGFALAQQWVGTVSATVGITNSDMSMAPTAKAANKQRFSLSFAPGYRIGSDGLLYGKVGYHSVAFEYTDTSTTVSSLTKTHQGFGFGAGYAMALSRNLELRAEVESVTYSGENTSATVKLTPKETNFTLGLLYRF
jgi:opacity protein-like surface antigen